jgi:hypothetical protein
LIPVAPAPPLKTTTSTANQSGAFRTCASAFTGVRLCVILYHRLANCQNIFQIPEGAESTSFITRLEYAKEKGARKLCLKTSSLLQPAIHLYKSAGFQIVAQEDSRLSRNARADVFMELIL